MNTNPLAPAQSFSTRELQAAAAALTAGQFSGDDSGDNSVDVPCAVPDGAITHRVITHRTIALRSSRSALASTADSPVGQGSALPRGIAPPRSQGAQGTTVATATMSTPALPRLVRVRAANAGAGASTVALSITDAAAAAGARCRILDAAAPPWSGLVGATSAELGTADGWRRGRRGATVTIDRVDDLVQLPGDVRAPRGLTGVDLTVLDVGWSMRELAVATGNATGDMDGGWLVTTLAEVEVLVTRGHRLALSQTEAVLAGLERQLSDRQVVVVVVGATRRSARVLAMAGPLLAEADQQEAVVAMPLLADTTLPSLGPDPLPRQMTHPARRLLERITTITGPLTGNPGLNGGSTR